MTTLNHAVLLIRKKWLLVVLWLLLDAHFIYGQTDESLLTVTGAGTGITNEQALNKAKHNILGLVYWMFFSSEPAGFLANESLVSRVESSQSGIMMTGNVLQVSHLPDSSWNVMVRA